MRKRRNGRKKLRLVIFFTVFLFLFMSIGYAAISTNITLNAKGNIKQVPIDISGLKEDVVTIGDGLYQDTVETDRYIYKGANPNNYIKFNGDEMWRIYSVESDGSIKIVKDESLGNMQFDSGYNNELTGISSVNSVIGTRYSSRNEDYCYYNSGTETQYGGCNVWGSKTTTLDSNGSVTTKMSRTAGDTSATYTLPESESYINVYLNHQFNNAVYKGLNSAKTGYEEITLPSYYTIDNVSVDYIKTATWNIGSPGYSFWNNGSPYGSTTSMSNMVNYEAYYKWSGKVGLLTNTEYMRANSNTSTCVNTLDGLDKNYSICKTTNYLNTLNDVQWLISPYSYSTSASGVLLARTAGNVDSAWVQAAFNVRPSVYLCKGLAVKGYGTEQKPYTISGECGE